MGKQRYQLEQLINLRASNQATLDSYGYLMDERGRSYHTSKAQYYDDQIMRQLPHVLDEMLEELVKRFEVKVKDEATPALRELNNELRRLGK